MRVFHLTVVLLVIGLLYATLSSVSPGYTWFDTQNVVINQLERFFDSLLHVLAIAALIKYLYSKPS